MQPLSLAEEVMIGALARQVKDGDQAACGTLSPMPAAALWLARLTHAPRGLIPQVDVVNAPGYTPELTPWQRPGRITSLVTPKCVFDLAPPQAPRLASLYPGVDLEEVRRLTGFEFRATEDLSETPSLDPEARRLLYGPVREHLAQVYPRCVARLTRPDG
jgi:acyl CoA:acetate/3-ketoacid CoA transferase beta subunit